MVSEPAENGRLPPVEKQAGGAGAQAFLIKAADNVATLLSSAGSGAEVALIGSGSGFVVRALCDIEEGHKIAVTAIRRGGAVRKFGVPIGKAVSDIEPGDWVHLHNLASDYDERSATLDSHSGAPTDISYE